MPGPDAPVGDQAAELLARARQVPALREQVRDLEADVVAGTGVAGPRVAEADEQEVDGRARPAAAEQAQERLAFVAALGGALLGALRGGLLALRSLLALADELGLFLDLGLGLLGAARRGDGRDDGLLEVVEQLDAGRRR